ncbi:MAG: hypothetical protein ACXAEN_25580 [Candidatus Thorarchaeota archaeon]|jgi:hypothetical protein
MSDAVDQYLKDAPVQVLDRIATQQLTLTNKIKHVEKKMQNIEGEFADMIDVLSQLISDHYAGMDTPGTIQRAESILEKMRVKYG